MQAERHAQILAYLENHDFLSLSEAVQRLQASRSTIWRDFLMLTSRNFVERTRGGIKKPTRGSTSVLPFDQRRAKFASQKDDIARRAVQLLQDGDVFIADGGTTTYHLAAHLPDMRLTLVTISIPLLLALSKHKRELRALEILVIGGVYDPDFGISLGTAVQESLARVHAQWTFLSVDGVTEDGISNNSYLTIESKRQMIRNSDKVAVLADHSKIGRRAMTQICGPDEIDLLITDECSDNAPALDKIRQSGLEVITANRQESVIEVSEQRL
jgi:DeoR/GlpR family transcriptional regulator of sugar metabolism